MKKSSLNILVLLLFASSLLAQEKYMIYFKDKGSLAKESLSKSNSVQAIAEKTLSKRSIDRRKKNLGENYFTFEDLPLENSYIHELQNLDIKILNKLKWFNAVSAYLNDEQFLELNSKSFIEKIENVKTLRSKKVITSEVQPENELKKYSATSTTYSYGPSLIQNLLSDIPAVHDLGITGEGVVIGLLDSGFEWKPRVSLQNAKVIAEHDFVNNDTTTANGSFSHGTSVFSILAGFHETFLIGPSFNSEFILAKTEYVPSETNVEEDNYAAALEWMDSIGVDITTSSLGYNIFDKGQSSYEYSDMDGETAVVTKAVELAFSKGIVTITSAGNEGNDPWKYVAAPADGKNIIAVGAVNSSNELANYSSRGPTFDGRIKPEVLAQGTSTYHATISGPVSYSASGSGTSYSAPIVAGIAGLLLSAHPHLTNVQVRNILLESSANVASPDTSRGYGLLSAIKAITYPNLYWDGSKFNLTKMFDNTTSVKDNIVNLKIEPSTEITLVNQGNNKFTTELPNLTNGNEYELYFTYSDESNTLHRIPADKNYKLNYGNLSIDLILTDVGIIEGIPQDFSLSQNYPNPFNPTTTIEYSVPNVESSKGFSIQLKVFNILGQEVGTLVNGIKLPGKHTVKFDSSNLSSGIYFYQLTSGSFLETKKMIYLR
ncbi:MAG: S8 family serine peptidase [Ignavibacteriae bacterium]|nr:S8 family serine peptidase [Ignavibacteriota bacterium]